jgi:hypothetical protein
MYQGPTLPGHRNGQPDRSHVNTPRNGPHGPPNMMRDEGERIGG